MPGKLPPPSTPPPRGGSSAPPPRASGNPAPLPKSSKAPPAPAGAQDAEAATPAQRAARNSSYALAAFTFIIVAALFAWFLSADQPWGFASFITVLSALLGVGTTYQLWRQPTREHAIAGLVVMGVSLLRVGLPSMWSAPSIVILTLTALLAIPLVQAVILLPRS
jgi:hypothetical protein